MTPYADCDAETHDEMYNMLRLCLGGFGASLPRPERIRTIKTVAEECNVMMTWGEAREIDKVHFA